LVFTLEVSRSVIVVLAYVTGPTFSQGIENKVAGVEISI
jgi:hypothetical protein